MRGWAKTEYSLALSGRPRVNHSNAHEYQCALMQHCGNFCTASFSTLGAFELESVLRDYHESKQSIHISEVRFPPWS